MKIDGYRAAQIAQAYGLQSVDGGQSKTRRAGQRPDSASLSAEAQELLQARRAVQDAPNVRAERVAALRQQVQDGTYQVDVNALARRMRFVLDLSEE